MQTAIETAWLPLWPQTEGGVATLINLSENHIYRIDIGGVPKFILRLHRPGYQSPQTIDSELAWIDALRADTDLPVPEPCRGIDGERVQFVDGRAGVMFVYKPGREALPTDDTVALFRVLGRYAAKTHLHVMTYDFAPGFIRPSWTAEAVLDADGLWGDWRQAPHVDGETLQTLTALDARLRRDLDAYGKGRHRFGLIHADMRLANVLIDGDLVRIIDFDDSGFCWLLYDFAAAISFYEDTPEIPALRAAWLEGYQAIRPLSDEDLTIIDALVLLRRMALLAWIGSHAETELAQSHAENFAAVTAKLAKPYLQKAQGYGISVLGKAGIGPQ